MIKALIQNNRTFRRFDETIKIERLQIERWLSVVRYTSSLRNIQPLKYIIVTDPEVCNQITANARWAGYLTEWAGPAEGERPTAYLIQLLDTDIASSARFDEGIQIEAITLMAVSDGYGACILRAFSTAEFARMFDLPNNLFPNCIIALGKPLEEVVIEEAQSPADVKYWRDENGVHHVPKRPIHELIVEPNKPSIF